MKNFVSKNFKVSIIKLTLLIIYIFLFNILYGQQIPSKPFSNLIFSPLIVNPAIIGSKDYTNFNLISRISGQPTSQLFSAHTRLTKQGDFTNFGFGGYVFHDRLLKSYNIGANAGGAYHIPIDKDKMSNISLGLILKGIYNVPIKDSELTTNDSINSTFSPNVDFGIYYYGPTAFAGISVTNGLGNLLNKELTDQDEAYIPREYHLYGGYKFLLNRKYAIVLEPSLLLSVTDETFSEAYKHINPYLKLYIQNGYIGTYYKDYDHLAFYLQYEFPYLFAGMFFEVPRKVYLTYENIVIEFILGINIGKEKSMFPRYRHW